MTIISVGIMVFIAAYDKIAKAITYTRARSLATFLAQEKVDQIRQISYYQVLASTATSYVTTLNPNIPYDGGNYFPQESVFRGGMYFSRYTYVEVVDSNGSGDFFVPVGAPFVPDTGYKRLTVTVTWTQGLSTYKVLTETVISNPGMIETNAILTGTVTDAASGAVIQGVQVYVAESAGWTDNTNVLGVYTIHIIPGGYHVEAVKKGYFNGDASVSVSAGTTVTQNFQLTAISTGTVSGSVWVNDHLVISQIVAATAPVSGAPAQGWNYRGKNEFLARRPLNEKIPSKFEVAFKRSGLGEKFMRATDWTRDENVGEVHAATHCAGNCSGSGGGGGAAFNYEWVEIFNPTTWTWTMANNPGSEGGGNGMIGLKFQRAQDISAMQINVIYGSTYIPSGGYYLFANTATVQAFGYAIPADAYWDPAGVINLTRPYFSIPSDPNIIPDAAGGSNHEGAGGLMLFDLNSGQTYDTVGWEILHGGPGWAQAPFSDDSASGFPINNGNNGLRLDEQFVRKSSTNGVDEVNLGPAYDANVSLTDFGSIYPMTLLPNNTSTSPQIIVAGKPAYGAFASVSDGLSSPTTAYQRGVTGTDPVWAEFDVPRVATGTAWYVALSSGLYSMEIDTVAVLGGATTWIPNSVTVDTWPYSGYYSAILSSFTDYGFISGQVTDVNNNPIASDIRIQAGDAIATADHVFGNYILQVGTGTYNVIANPSNLNTSFVTSSSQNVTVNLGEIHSNVNFILSNGGRATGWVTADGINALPAINVSATDAGGVVVDQEVSGADGSFLMINLTTGTYTIQPILDSKEISTPASANVTVGVGAEVSAGTFTISNYFGQITGTCYLSGVPIPSGVTIMITTVTLPGVPPVPPTLSSNTLTGAVYYASASEEKGNYTVPVRASTTPYCAYAWYFYQSGAIFSSFASSVCNIIVSAGQTVSGINFSW